MHHETIDEHLNNSHHRIRVYRLTLLYCLPASQIFSLLTHLLRFDWIRCCFSFSCCCFNFFVALSSIINLFIIVNGITLTSFVRFFVNYYLSNKHGIWKWSVLAARSELSECVSHFMRVCFAHVCRLSIINVFSCLLHVARARPPMILLFHSISILCFISHSNLFIFTVFLRLELAFLLFFFQNIVVVATLLSKTY